MKYTLFSIALSLISFATVGQTVVNASLSTTKEPRFGIVPDNWTKEGVATTLFSYNEKELAISLSNLFPGSKTTDVFFGFFSNNINQWGGFSQQIYGLEVNREYCISFEAAANRPWEPNTQIDFELYFNNELFDSETFIYPSDSSQIVDLCFVPSSRTDGKLLLRTNNLVGNTTYVLIKAGSGSFYESTTTSSLYEPFTNEISISPNPTTGILSLELEENSSEYRIAVYSADGTKHLEDRKYAPDNIDISTMEPGLYYLEIIKEKKRMVKNIILTK